MASKITQQDVPHGWVAKNLGEVLTVGSGKDYKHLDGGEVPVFGTGGYMLSVNKPLYDGETVFIGRKGTIDRPFYFKGKFWTVDTLFYTYNFKDTSAKYINLIFQKINWKSYNEASGVPSLSKTTIEKIPFIFPPENEQNRIVRIVETWDEAIEKLGQVIELKREVKKGLMQKLLTGELRLPGFKNDWVSDKLGAFVSVQSGDGFPIRLQGKKIGKYPFIKVSDMNSPQNLKKIIDANNYIDEQEVSEINGRIFEKQSIVFPKIGAAIATNKKRILTTQTLVDNNVAVLVPDTSRCDGSFLYQWMLRFDLMNWANSGGVPSIRKTAIESHPIIFPELDEQKAIGSLLDTCDEEIEILERKKTLFLNQKKYLLNNLVTGQIRTPENL